MHTLVTITFLMLVLVVLISLLAGGTNAVSSGFSYKIVPEEDSIFIPCPGEEDKFVDQFFDMSDLTFDRVDEETVVLNGKIVWTFDMKKKHKVKATIDVERENNGLWLPTPMTIEREDICDRMFVSSEYWFEFVKDFIGDQRVCPPAVGTSYSFPNAKAFKIVNEIPDGTMEGHYRMIFRLNSPHIDLCCMATSNVYKIM